MPINALNEQFSACGDDAKSDRMKDLVGDFLYQTEFSEDSYQMPLQGGDCFFSNE